MGKFNLRDWAAISEIVASIGVIVSILFLAYSIRESTVATQSENDNFIYDLQFERIREISGNPSLALLYTKLGNGEELTEIEQTQLLWDNLQQLGTWEIAFVRYRDGVYSDEQWQAWDHYLRRALLENFSEEDWDSVSDWYLRDFRNHVEEAFAERQATH